jgi:opacity protein-like surface antigen
MVTGYHAAEYLNHTQADRIRLKNSRMLGFDHTPGNLYINKVEARFKWGQRDTRDDDERDDDSDYKFRQYNVKTLHKINDRLKTTLKYDYFIKDYNVIGLGHKGFYLANGYDYEILNDDKQRSWLNFGLGRKDTRYIEITGNDYRKITADIRLNYSRKKNWKGSIGIERSAYKYDDEANDKKRYYAELSVEKLFLNGGLNVDLDLKYRLTDYGQRSDDEQKAVRVGVGYEF